MRDEHYRSRVWIVDNYDAVIDWIRDNNPFIKSRSQEEREEFAVDAVNSCIRSVIFNPDGNTYCSTGMCIAVRMSNDPNRAGYQEVMLAVTGLHHLQAQP